MKYCSNISLRYIKPCVVFETLCMALFVYITGTAQEEQERLENFLAEPRVRSYMSGV